MLVEFNPLPLRLTKEILIDFGFIEHENNTFIKENIVLKEIYKGYYQFYLESISSTLLKNVRYANELQNLYFAIKENELKMNYKQY
jgi:hypothetical protein